MVSNLNVVFNDFDGSVSLFQWIQPLLELFDILYLDEIINVTYSLHIHQ